MRLHFRFQWTKRPLSFLREAASSNPYAARNPQLGRPGRVDGTCELVMGNSPYILPYRVRADRIEILAVYHGARKWPESF